MWTDVFQALVMVAGIIAVIVVVSNIRVNYNQVIIHRLIYCAWQGLAKIGGESFFEEIQTRDRFKFQ